MKYFSVLAGIILTAAVLMILYVTIMLVWPFKIIEAEQPFEVKTPVVKAGTELVYQGNYMVHTDKEFMVTWEIIDLENPEVPIVLPQTGRLHVPPGSITLDRKLIIPSETPPGRYKIRVIDTVRINSFRSVTKDFITGEFEVIK